MTDSKLRISILGLNYDPEPTGIAPYTTGLAEQLKLEGHEVIVLTGYPHYPAWKLADGYDGWRKNETINGVQVRRLRHYIPRRVSNIQRLHMELSFGLRLFLARWGDPDVVLLVSPALFSSALVMLRARLGLRRPATGVWVQDIYSRGMEETTGNISIATRLVKNLEGTILRAATGVSVIHARFRRFVTTDLRVPGEKVRVIRNWTHVAPASPFDRKEMRARFGWGEEDVIVLHAGNIGVKQALENVVDAARIADERRSKVRFVLMGDGNQRGHIENLAHGVNHIQFISPLPGGEFTQALAAADILLINESPGLKEMAVPSKLTSYFSSGRPVVAATAPDSTTAEEIAISGGGLRVEPGAPEELLKTIEELAGNHQKIRNIADSGRAYSETVLARKTAIVQYSDWLLSLARAKKGTGSHVTADK